MCSVTSGGFKKYWRTSKMKITKSQLKQIIKKELREALNEDEYDAFNEYYNIKGTPPPLKEQRLNKPNQFNRALQSCKMGLDSIYISVSKRGFVKSIKTFWAYEMNEFNKRLQLNYQVDCNNAYTSITYTEDLNKIWPSGHSVSLLKIASKPVRISP